MRKLSIVFALTVILSRSPMVLILMFFGKIKDFGINGVGLSYHGSRCS